MTPGGEYRAGVQVEGLVKDFATLRALDSVDLSIGAGQFFSLLGPSGCGKTTLLRLLAGLETPTAGRIRIDGIDVTDLPPERRPTNMVFQSYALFPHLDVRDNVAYGLRAERLARRAIESRVDDALALVRLEGFHGRRPHELSGGQRQRVALARALAKRPRVLLLDEPMAALDRQLREAVRRELRELQRRVGITFVLVTHDQDEAFALSDAIAVMSGGRVLQVAAPAELYGRPNCVEVASFVGAVNLVAGRVERVEAAKLQIDAGPLGMVMATRPAAQVAVGAPVTLAIRPESVVMSVDRGARASSAHAAEAHAADVHASGAPAMVLATDYLGDRTYIRVAVAGLAAPLLSCQFGSSNAGRFPVGSPVWISLSGEHAAMPA
jgi:ABC-type Fe3+/spermidine/putrescine transport system ATPase subunit